MTGPQLPYYLPWAVAAAYSALPAYLDFKYRQVPEHFWYLGGKVGAVVGLLTALSYEPLRLLLVLYAFSMLAAGAVALSSALGGMGLGDLWASMAIALTLPAPLPGSVPLPPSLLVVLYAAAAEISTRALIAARLCRPLRLGCLGRIEVPCGRLLRMRWWFPAESSVTSDEPTEAVVEACQGDKSSVVARPGLPFVTFILIALPLAFLTEALLRVP